MAPLVEEGLGRLASVAGSAVVGVDLAGVVEIAPVGDAQPYSTYRIASLTKPVTAVATVLAARRAGVGLDTPVRTLLPELGDDWSADDSITIAHVLSQTSGLAPTVSADIVAALGSGDRALIEAAREAVAAGSAREPGRSWEYYNGNYFLAGAIVAKMYVAPFESAVTDLVLRPCGMAATIFESPSAYPRGRRPSGGLRSTAGDLLAFARHLLDDRDLLDVVRTARTRADDPMQYGLGWALGPSGQLYLNGRLEGYRAALLLVPDHDLAGVALAADSDALPAEARLLSDLQQPFTGDDLTERIDGFAA